eukprot:9589640-Alexandrium_andersonii.AAC.1
MCVRLVCSLPDCPFLPPCVAGECTGGALRVTQGAWLGWGRSRATGDFRAPLQNFRSIACARCYQQREA